MLADRARAAATAERLRLRERSQAEKVQRIADLRNHAELYFMEHVVEEEPQVIDIIRSNFPTARGNGREVVLMRFEDLEFGYARWTDAGERREELRLRRGDDWSRQIFRLEDLGYALEEVEE